MSYDGYAKLTPLLKKYVNELHQRFTFGGVYDTYKIPSGEEFIEVTCDGIPDGNPQRVYCCTEEKAVELFIDTFERHIIQKRNTGVLHWHTYPDQCSTKVHILSMCTVWPASGGEYQEIDHKRKTVWSIYARAVLV